MAKRILIFFGKKTVDMYIEEARDMACFMTSLELVEYIVDTVPSMFQMNVIEALGL